MKNIDTAFRYIRLFTLLVITGCLGLCVYVLYNSYQLSRATQSKIYVLANGKAIEAFAKDRNENIEVEAKDHITTFHGYFFILAPDEGQIKASLEKALYLADGSAERIYENYQENNYYNGIISGNISQTLQVDSIDLNTNSYPYWFRCYATETLTRTTSITYRSLVTEGYLRNVRRSDHDPHGFLIERWTIKDNRDLKTVRR